MPFRAVNRADRPGHDPGFQRHHLLPRQLLAIGGFGPLFAGIGPARVGFDDFRRNGLLLPASDRAALRLGLPLHRGPHRAYNALVIERVGEVEAAWARARRRSPEAAAAEAIERLGALQRALRWQLLSPAARRWRLNRHDPCGKGPDFAAIDALVADLWPATDAAMAAAAPAPGWIMTARAGPPAADVGDAAPPARRPPPRGTGGRMAPATGPVPARHRAPPPGSGDGGSAAVNPAAAWTAPLA